MQEPVLFGSFISKENCYQNILFEKHMDVEFRFHEKGMGIKGIFPYQGQT
jgi:hypothetical protein